jgi:hypothetical protein
MHMSGIASKKASALTKLSNVTMVRVVERNPLSDWRLCHDNPQNPARELANWPSFLLGAGVPGEGWHNPGGFDGDLF